MLATYIPQAKHKRRAKVLYRFYKFFLCFLKHSFYGGVLLDVTIICRQLKNGKQFFSFNNYTCAIVYLHVPCNYEFSDNATITEKIGMEQIYGRQNNNITSVDVEVQTDESKMKLETKRRPRKSGTQQKKGKKVPTGIQNLGFGVTVCVLTFVF